MALNYSCRNNVNIFRFKCTGGSDSARTPSALLEDVDEPKLDDGGEGGGKGRFSSGGGGGGGDGGENDGDGDEEEFGPIMKFEDVAREAEKRGVNLPDDMLEAAKTMGLRRLVLTRYLDLQVKMCLFLFIHISYKHVHIFSYMEYSVAEASFHFHLI